MATTEEVVLQEQNERLRAELDGEKESALLMMSSHKNDTAIQAGYISQLRKERDVLRKLLKIDPFVYDKEQETDFCLWCGNARAYGHSKSCEYVGAVGALV